MKAFEPMVKAELAKHLALTHTLADSPFLLQEIAHVAETLQRTLTKGHKLLICGNGGSAADAQHIAAELVVKFIAHRPAYPAMALNTDTSIITAAGNDLGYTSIFSRQIEALGRQHDMLLAISTSGKSPNILEAIRAAKKANMVTVALTGQAGMAITTDYAICIPSFETARIQEMHILVGHMLCEALE